MLHFHSKIWARQKRARILGTFSKSEIQESISLGKKIEPCPESALGPGIDFLVVLMWLWLFSTQKTRVLFKVKSPELCSSLATNWSQRWKWVPLSQTEQLGRMDRWQPLSCCCHLIITVNSWICRSWDVWQQGWAYEDKASLTQTGWRHTYVATTCKCYKCSAM